MTVSAQVNGYQHAPAGVTEPYWPGLKDTVARTSIRGRWVSVDHRFSKYSKSHVKISRSNRFTSSAVSPDASHQRYAPQKLDSHPALDLPQQHTEGLAVSAYLAGSARNRVRGVAPRAAVADAIVADDMMLISYKGRRIPQPG